ncbi:hypothetical protein [Treponema sp. R6D11]
MYEKWKDAQTPNEQSAKPSTTKSSKRIVINDFSGGINYSPAVYNLKPTEARDAFNVSTENMPALAPKDEYEIFLASTARNVIDCGKLHNGHWFQAVRTNSTTTTIYDMDLAQSITTLNHSGLFCHAIFFHANQGGNCTVFYTSTGEMKVVLLDGTVMTYNQAFPVEYMCFHESRIVVANSTHNTSLVTNQDHCDYMNEMYDYITVGAPGETCRGLVSYKGSIFFFTPTSIYKISTNYPILDVDPANDQFKHKVTAIASNCGASHGNTIADVLGTLFWYGNGRVYSYSGGKVEVVSRQIKKYLEKVRKRFFTTPPKACAVGEFYYLLFNFEDDPSVMLTYDTINKSWQICEGENFVSFYKNGFDIVAAASNSVLKSLYSKNGGYKDWSYKSPYFSAGDISGFITIKAELDANAFIKVYVKADDAPNRELVGTVNKQGDVSEFVFDYPVGLNANSKVSIELEGEKKSIVHSISL